MSVLVKIYHIKNELTDSERIVADYIVNHTNEAPYMSVTSIADATYTSNASVVRFCKKIGYKGFKDFKTDLILSTINQDNKQDYDDQKLLNDNSISSAKESIIHNNIQVLQETIDLLSDEAIERTANAINHAKRMNVFGIGQSHLISLDMQMKFQRINRQCDVFVDSHTQLVAASLMNKGDVAIAISYSGKTEEVNNAIEVAKERGAFIAAITKYGDTPLSQLSDVNLFCSSKESGFRTSAQSSRMAQLSVVDILYVAYAQINREESMDYLKRTHSIVRKYKN